MKFKFKKAVGLSAMAMILLCLTLPVNSYAANTLLSVSKKDIKAGDSFNVTISGAQSSNLSLHYDGTMVTLKGQGNATLNGNTLSVSGRSATFTFEAKKAGSAGFVASSDRYSRSSVMLSIGEAASTPAATESSTAETKKDSQTKKTTNTKKDTQKVDTAASEEKNTKETAAVENPSDESEVSVQDNAEPQEVNTAFSSSDLTFKQLILDRRVMLIIAVLLAIIIILVIRLIWLHFDDYDDYDDEDDEGEPETEIVNSPVKEKPAKKETKKETDVDDLYEKLKAEEKLTMPKASTVPEKKLHLEDLNNL